MITPIRRNLLRRNLREQLVDEIGKDIVSGRIGPGEALPGEDVMLARFSVSRTVLREALHVLSAKGFLEPRPKRGTLVRPRNEWNQLDPVVLSWQGNVEVSATKCDLADDLMEVRRIVEPGAAALAARRGTEDDLAKIKAAYEAMEKAEGTAEALMEADLAFHTACLYASNNSYLYPTAHAIRSEMLETLRITGKNPGTSRRVALPLHKAVLDAILAHDPEAAARAMTRHLGDEEQRRPRRPSSRKAI